MERFEIKKLQCRHRGHATDLRDEERNGEERNGVRVSLIIVCILALISSIICVTVADRCRGDETRVMLFVICMKMNSRKSAIAAWGKRTLRREWWV